MKEKIKLDYICKLVVKIFYILAGAAFFWLFLNIVLNNCFIDPVSYGYDHLEISSYYNPIILTLLVVLFMFLLTKISDLKITSKKFIPFILFPVIIILQIYLSTYLIYDISDLSRFTDLGTIIDAAQCILSGNSYVCPWNYFQNTPYQVGMLGEIIVWNKIMFAIGLKSFNVNCIALNIISIDLAILGGYITSRIIWDNCKMANMFLIISSVFSPFYTFITYYYSDSLSIPFAIWGVCIYSYITLKGPELKNWKKALLWFAMIMVFVMGIMIKASVGIALIAIVIHMVVSRKSIVKVFCIALSFFVAFSCFKTITYARVDRSSWFDFEISEADGYPIAFWLLMGSNERRLGAYPPEDVYAIIGLSTREEQRDTAIQLTTERIKNYGVAGYLKFLTNKNGWIWGDGKYFATELLGWFPHTKSSKILDFFTKDAIGDPIFAYGSQCMQVLILAYLLKSFFEGAKSGKADMIFVINLSIFGVLIFFSFWEARPRYIYNYTPFLILSAISGLEQSKGWVRKFLNRFLDYNE